MVFLLNKIKNTLRTIIPRGVREMAVPLGHNIPYHVQSLFIILNTSMVKTQ